MPKIGPTNEFLGGKPMLPNDQGGLYARLSIDYEHRLFNMTFGTSVKWMGTPISEAQVHVDQIRMFAKTKFNCSTAAKSTTRFRVVVTPDKQSVVTEFSDVVTEFIGSPEEYLLWADMLEEQIKQYPAN